MKNKSNLEVVWKSQVVGTTYLHSNEVDGFVPVDEMEYRAYCPYCDTEIKGARETNCSGCGEKLIW